MKKWFLLSIAVAIMLPISVKADETEETVYYINNNGISMTEREYNNLLNVGFKDFEIQNMNIDTFNTNKDYDDAFVEAEAHRYYKTVYSEIDGSVISNEEITKYEFDHANLNCRGDGEVVTGYKDLTSTITYLASNAKRFRASLHWLSIPSKRSYDIIGAGFSDANIYVSSGAPSLETTYCTSSTNCTTVNSGYNYKVTASGAGASFQLPSGYIISLYSTIYYSVKKNTSNTITYLRMAGDYAHATSTVTSNQAKQYSLGYDGLYLDGSIMSYYDAMDAAVATWYGSW
jgi:hypothetical protein